MADDSATTPRSPLDAPLGGPYAELRKWLRDCIKRSQWWPCAYSAGCTRAWKETLDQLDTLEARAAERYSRDETRDGGGA